MKSLRFDVTSGKWLSASKRKLRLWRIRCNATVRFACQRCKTFRSWRKGVM